MCNPIGAEIQVVSVQLDAKIDGETYAHVDHAFENFFIPAHGKANSGEIQDVILDEVHATMLRTKSPKHSDIRATIAMR